MTYPTISDNPQVQALYEEIRTSGESHSIAEMLSLRQVPNLQTDTRWLAGMKDTGHGHAFYSHQMQRPISSKSDVRGDWGRVRGLGDRAQTARGRPLGQAVPRCRQHRGTGGGTDRGAGVGRTDARAEAGGGEGRVGCADEWDAMMGLYLREPRTTQERRLTGRRDLLDCDGYRVRIRAKRNATNLPDAYDDIVRGDLRSRKWKRQG
jgi:hypothetical protein